MWQAARTMRSPAQPCQPDPADRAPAGSALDHSPRAIAQRRLIAEVFGASALASPEYAAPVQRVLTFNGQLIPAERITGSGAFKTRLNAVISEEAASAGLAPHEIRTRLVEMASDGAQHDHDSKRDAVLAAVEDVQDATWAALGTRQDIVYRLPALTEAAARAILTGIEKAQPNALQGLTTQGRPFVAASPAASRGNEWGLLKSKTRADECVLVIGDATGVNWGRELLKCGVAIAHAHPYFGGGKLRDRYGKINLSTKEIADHLPNMPGAILWQSLADRPNDDSRREVSKIFPSASDIEFSAKKHVADHTVYTPYAVVRHTPTNTIYIFNPNVGDGHFQDAPRLTFVIQNAAPAGDGLNYTCMLHAREGTAVIWSRQVTTNGIGQFGLLRW